MRNLIILFLALLMVTSTAGAQIIPLTVDVGLLSTEDLLLLKEQVEAELMKRGKVIYFDLEANVKGEEVSRLQQRLMDLGYYDGRMTGRFDGVTRLAQKMFEKANGLESDGVASQADQEVLYSENAVPKVTSTPQPAQTSWPDPKKAEGGSDSAKSRYSVEIVQNCWSANSGFSETLYTPYLKIKVGNNTGRHVSKVTVQVVFYDMSNNSIWSDETSFLVSSGDTPLKDGFSKTAYIRSGVGYKRQIAILLLPAVSAEIFVNGELYSEVEINRIFE